MRVLPRTFTGRVLLGISVLSIACVAATALIVGSFVSHSVTAVLDDLLPDRYTVVMGPDGFAITAPACLVRRVQGGDVVYESLEWPLLAIPPERAGPEYEMFVTGPGCGLLRGPVVTEERIALPPPIHLTVAVPGTFPLPDGDSGVQLTLHWAGDRALARVLDRAPTPAATDLQTIWIDSTSRTATVCLPCPGPWRIEWLHTTGRPGMEESIGLVFAHGEAPPITIAGDGERHELAIDPTLLDGGFHETERR